MGLSLTPLHGQLDHGDEVGGMARSGQSTEPLERLVDGARVGVLLDDVGLPVRLHPDEGHLGEEDLGLGLLKRALFVVPSAPFDEQSIDVGAIGSLLRLVEAAVVLHLVVPIDLIDRDHVLSREVLLETGEERLSEEEAGDPEVGRLALFDPLADEVQSFNEVDNVRGKRLERGVRPLGPGGRDPVIEERVADVLKLAAHDNLTLNSELDVLERARNDPQQVVES